MINEPSALQRPLDRLLAIMAALRDPQTGCPWDLQQTFATIAPYTIEEAYEVVDAIDRGDLADLKDELGDLLLQVVFHARIAEERGDFRFDDVADAICDKMVRRHPHVFADAMVASLDDQSQAWEDIKSQERADKGRSSSILDDVPVTLPALTRAVKLSKRAARVGFVWSNTQDVLEKLIEEVDELRVEIKTADREKIFEELGDLLFVCANLARDLDIDPEAALRAANAKFIRRFQFIEAALAHEGRAPGQSNLEEMEAIWQAAKAAEKQRV
jgi:tetrapyrrole methylase family protein/MazG family protein/ATP diphosphatase